MHPMSFAIGSEEFRAAELSLSEALVLGASRVLGIDSTELASGSRELPPFPDDENVLGYVELFLYDTTPGGAGFADRVFRRVEEVLGASLDILTSCSCSHSCQKCLRTYENRIWHGKLDRYLAAALLDYAINGRMPIVAEERMNIISEQVENTIRMMNTELGVERTESGIWRIFDEKKNVFSYRFQSCLLTPDHDNDCLDVTDYEVLHKLPLVAHRLLEGHRIVANN